MFSKFNVCLLEFASICVLVPIYQDSLVKLCLGMHSELAPVPRGSFLSVSYSGPLVLGCISPLSGILVCGLHSLELYSFLLPIFYRASCCINKLFALLPFAFLYALFFVSFSNLRFCFVLLIEVCL